MAIIYYLILIIQTSGSNLFQLLPYLTVGVVIGELLAFTSLSEKIQKHLLMHPKISVFSASIAGAVSPLCTYGTIPVVIRLYCAGVPLAPLIVFLSSSSMMNPQLFLLTMGGISIETAMVRFVFVLAFSVLLGVLVSLLPPSWVVNPGFPMNSSDGGTTPSYTCSSKVFTLKSFTVQCAKSLEHTGFYIIVGVIAGAAIEVLIPQQLMLAAFKPQSWFSVLSASLLGIPLYACGGGVIPFIGSLVKEGMSKGAAFAFLTVGQATRIQPLIALAALIRPAFILFYVLLLIIFSTLTGIMYN